MPREEFSIYGGKRVLGVAYVKGYGTTKDGQGNLKTTRLLEDVFVSDGGEKVYSDHMWVWKVDPRLWKIPSGYIITFMATVNTYGKRDGISYCLENLRVLSMEKS